MSSTCTLRITLTKYAGAGARKTITAIPEKTLRNRIDRKARIVRTGEKGIPPSDQLIQNPYAHNDLNGGIED